jgi:hypothetical protein
MKEKKKITRYIERKRMKEKENGREREWKR